MMLIAGGKSFGGRMTSQAHAASALPNVSGLAFLGFPLHASGKPSTDRASHLSKIFIPMLFLQGGKDKLAELLSSELSPKSSVALPRFTSLTKPITHFMCQN